MCIHINVIVDHCFLWPSQTGCVLMLLNLLLKSINKYVPQKYNIYLPHLSIGTALICSIKLGVQNVARGVHYVARGALYGSHPCHILHPPHFVGMHYLALHRVNTLDRLLLTPFWKNKMSFSISILPIDFLQRDSCSQVDLPLFHQFSLLLITEAMYIE